jgi:hypothetical protein
MRCLNFGKLEYPFLQEEGRETGGRIGTLFDELVSDRASYGLFWWH